MAGTFPIQTSCVSVYDTFRSHLNVNGWFLFSRNCQDDRSGSNARMTGVILATEAHRDGGNPRHHHAKPRPRRTCGHNSAPSRVNGVCCAPARLADRNCEKSFQRRLFHHIGMGEHKCLNDQLPSVPRLIDTS